MKRSTPNIWLLDILLERRRKDKERKRNAKKNLSKSQTNLASTSKSQDSYHMEPLKCSMTQGNKKDFCFGKFDYMKYIFIIREPNWGKTEEYWKEKDLQTKHFQVLKQFIIFQAEFNTR